MCTLPVGIHTYACNYGLRPIPNCYWCFTKDHFFICLLAFVYTMYCVLKASDWLNGQLNSVMQLNSHEVLCIEYHVYVCTRSNTVHLSFLLFFHFDMLIILPYQCSAHSLWRLTPQCPSLVPRLHCPAFFALTGFSKVQKTLGSGAWEWG